MRYPVLSRAVAAELVQELIRGEQPELDAFVTWEGSGPKLNIEPFADTAASLRDALKNFEMSDAKADADMFEGQASPAIHEMLTGLPLAIIDDLVFGVNCLSSTSGGWPIGGTRRRSSQSTRPCTCDTSMVF